MDQVNRTADGAIEIVDYKTGRPRDGKKAAEDLQLSVYALAAQDVLGLKPDRLVFYNLNTNEAIVTSRDAKSLAATKQKISCLADQIRAREFAPQPGFSCSFCDFKPLCPAHEQLINIQPDDGREALARLKKTEPVRMAAPFSFPMASHCFRSLDQFRA